VNFVIYCYSSSSGHAYKLISDVFRGDLSRVIHDIFKLFYVNYNFCNLERQISVTFIFSQFLDYMERNLLYL